MLGSRRMSTLSSGFNEATGRDSDQCLWFQRLQGVTIHRPRSNSAQVKYQLVLMEGAPKVGQKDNLMNRTENLKNSISGFAMLLLWSTSNDQPNQTKTKHKCSTNWARQWSKTQTNRRFAAWNGGKNSKCINAIKARARFTLSLHWMIYTCALTLTDVVCWDSVCLYQLHMTPRFLRFILYSGACYELIRSHSVESALKRKISQIHCARR